MIGAVENAFMMVKADGAWIGDDGKTGDRFRLML